MAEAERTPCATARAPGDWGVFEADSLDEVREIAEADPAISSGMATHVLGAMPVTIVS